jgi:hypothetical protein
MSRCIGWTRHVLHADAYEDVEMKGEGGSLGRSLTNTVTTSRERKRSYTEYGEYGQRHGAETLAVDGKTRGVASG